MQSVACGDWIFLGELRRWECRCSVVFFASIPLSFVSMDAAYYSWWLVAVGLIALRSEGRATRAATPPGTADRGVPACLEDGACAD